MSSQPEIPDANIYSEHFIADHSHDYSLRNKLSVIAGTSLSLSLLFGCTSEAEPAPIVTVDASASVEPEKNPKPSPSGIAVSESPRPSTSIVPKESEPTTEPTVNSAPLVSEQEVKKYGLYINSSSEEYRELPESEKSEFGNFLRKKYSLKLPYTVPQRPQEASPEGLISNYNYNLTVALPTIIEQGTLDEATKYLFTFMSPQKGDDPSKNDVSMRATLIEGYLSNEAMDFNVYAENNSRSLAGNNGDAELYPTKNAVAISTFITKRPDDPYGGLRMYFSIVKTEQGYDAPLISITQ